MNSAVFPATLYLSAPDIVRLVQRMGLRACGAELVSAAGPQKP